LLSDFPVTPTEYQKLAKLVLIAALSKESKLLAERITGKRTRALTTTAFSKNPVSMKYRGLFQLIKRKENKIDLDGLDLATAYSLQPYELNYGARMGDWSLQEGLDIWKKKHGQKLTAGKRAETE
jgi:hypothetical protein